jgi:hypothetical protein
LNRNSMDINIDICTVNRDKKFWLNLVIWGKYYGVIYMGGRQIFESAQEVHKRGGLNKRIIANRIIQYSLLLLSH